MCMFGYLKTPDIILSLVVLVSSQKLDWTQNFETYCTSINYAFMPISARIS